jgi:hypothetical protein
MNEKIAPAETNLGKKICGEESRLRSEDYLCGEELCVL